MGHALRDLDAMGRTFGRCYSFQHDERERVNQVTKDRAPEPAAQASGLSLCLNQ